MDLAFQLGQSTTIVCNTLFHLRTCAAKMQFKKAIVDFVEVVVLGPFKEHVALLVL